MGEIFPRVEDAALALEPRGARVLRLHRYYLARSFGRGLDVLDAAGGLGDGAALLAQTARTVVCRVGNQADAERAQAAFGRDNLRFAAIGWDEIADASLDLVVADALLERLTDARGFLAAMRRVLRPDGVLLLSTPDRDIYSAPGAAANALHAHEYSRAELTALLGGVFQQTRLFGQRGLIGSALLAEAPGPPKPWVFEHRGPLHAEFSDGLPRVATLFCLASDADLSTVPDSLFIDSEIAVLERLAGTADQAERELDRLRRAQAGLVADAQDRRAAEAAHRHALAVLRVSEAAALSQLRHARTQFEAGRAGYEALLARMLALEQQALVRAAAAQDECARLRAAGQQASAREAAALADSARLRADGQEAAARAEAASSEAARLRADGQEAAARAEAALRACVRLQVEEQEASARADAARAECARLQAALDRPPLGLPARVIRRLRRLRPWAPRPRLIRHGALFAPEWYLARYPDVGMAGVDPALHYADHGAAEGRWPGPNFDPDWYAAQHPEVSQSGLQPLAHFERFGRAAGWPTLPPPEPDSENQPKAQPELAVAASSEPQSQEPAWALEPQFDAEPEPATEVPPEPSPEPEPEPEPESEASAEPDPPPEPEPEPAPLPPAPLANPHVLFIAGEPETPGTQYRCVRMAAAARAAGYSAGWSRLDQTGAIELIGVKIAVLWRVRWSEHVAGIMRELRQQNGLVVFDIDDLMVEPTLARVSIIDGIRSTNSNVAGTRETFAQVQQSMLKADLCSATTTELAQHMRAWRKPVYVLPNGFDAATLAASRLAVRQRARAGGDELVRIGYAAGTITHQKDFSVALAGIVAVLAARGNVRLVLFRVPAGPELVVVEEFEALAPFGHQIEWRDRVDLDGLPAELARFDINIAPLELGNPFCEAKSELKFFEAALVGVPTLASPTGPFARAIRHGHTGMLAANDADWTDMLLRLVDDRPFRQELGRAAYGAVLWTFGPERQAEIVGSFLHQLAGGREAARAFALDVAQGLRPVFTLPEFANSETLFARDRMGQARVTVVVPCFNYADTIIEALESVRGQSLDLLDLVVVDDCSTDPLTPVLIAAWASRHEGRFNRLIVLRHRVNAGLSAARNTGFDAAETDFVMALDADNRLLPDCCATLLAALNDGGAFAYPSVQQFEAADLVFCDEPYRPVRLVSGNYIDAMALIAKWAWAAAGGYNMPRGMGWEDFDLWCKLAELGQWGVHVPAVMAEYRVHGGSMVASVVEVETTKQAMVTVVEARHPWLRMLARAPAVRI